MYESHAHHNGHEESFWVEPEAQPFWGFTFSGNVSLEELARFYGLRVAAPELGLTLNAYLERNPDGHLRPGHRVAVGGADLRVLEMSDGAVRRVGLELRPTRFKRSRYPRRVYRRSGVATEPLPYKVA